MTYFRSLYKVVNMFRLEMVILHEDRRELENNERRMSHLQALLSFRPNNVLSEEAWPLRELGLLKKAHQ
jgi:hypothetical protein